jgi:hypothetical protein
MEWFNVSALLTILASSGVIDDLTLSTQYRRRGTHIACVTQANAPRVSEPICAGCDGGNVQRRDAHGRYLRRLLRMV